MAAPTLTINVGGKLEIADGTSGDSVTWNDVWDWDDGGGSSGGDGDVPIDGGGTAKVSTYMTEVVEDAVYLILDDVTFGDGASSSYFQSKNEMVRFAEGKEFQIKSSATLKLGEKIGDWAVDGSCWSIGPTATWLPMPFGQSGTFLVYDSIFDIRNNFAVQFQDGDLDIIQSSFKYRDATFDTANLRFKSTLNSLNIKNLYCSSLNYLEIGKVPDSITGVHVHNSRLGILSVASVTVSNSLITNAADADYFASGGIDLVVFNPISSVNSPRIQPAGGTIVESYPCNIHVTDKDGVDLQSVGVDCEYAHLVEGTDSKTYKCIQDHTSVDATHKPITGNDWESFWELFDVGGGLGGNWTTGFDYKADAEEFATETTDANGDIAEQIVQYKKWTTTSELLEARIHKFTYTHASYPDSIINDIIVDHPLVWEFDMGQSTSDLTTIVQDAAPTVNEIWAKAMVDLAAGAPSATASVLTAVNYIFEAWRNKTVTDEAGNEIIIYKDDGATKLCESDISDDGTLFTKGEYRTPD